jgi:hypothetical protein
MPFKWHKCNNLDEMQSFFESIIPAIREVAKECGYAIGVHGSMRRDLDLVAVPWVDGHMSPTGLAVEIQKAATNGLSINREHIKWEIKPCGRIATSLPVCWINWPDAKDGTGHIDLSVMVSV